MSKKYKFFTIIISALFFACPLFAQVSIDPEDDFYTEATAWFLKGYVKNLPQIKPYPINVIQDIINQVKECGSETEVKQAKYYEKKYLKNKISGSSQTQADIKIKHLDSGGSDETKKYDNEELFLERLTIGGDIPINEKIGIAFDVAGSMRNTNVDIQNVFPRYFFDDDHNKIEVLSLNTEHLDFILDPNFNVFFGSTNLYATFGLNKTGVGVFADDSLVMNPSAYQTLNGTFNYTGQHFSYSQYFGFLAANNYSDFSDYSELKYLSFHSLRIPIPKTKFAFTMYESVIFAKPFMPAYFMPVPYFIIANVSGFNENVLSGLKLQWKPLNCILISSDFLIDDLKPKSLLKLKLNDAAIRTGFKAGFVYSPFNSFCNFISVSYTLITPYTYTKYNGIDDKYNYLDYTNFGSSMASNLPPNSDRLNLTISFKPTTQLKISTISSLIRHSNAYEDLELEEVKKLKKGFPSDGSIKMDTRNLDTAVDYTGFLKQDSTMYIIQAGLFGEYEFITSKAGRFSISLQYIYEYIANDGIDQNIYSGGYDEAGWEERAKKELKAWQDNLHDSYNHYFTIGVKYRYL